jgi:hypothetical protein
MRYIEREIQHRSEVYIESQRAAVLADDLPMPAIETWIINGEHISSGWSRANGGPKSIDGSTFKIDTGKKRCLDTLLTIPKKLPCLLRTLDVAREQNDARRLHSQQQGSETRRYLHPVKSNNH